MTLLTAVFLLVLAVEAVWWIIWIGLAFSKKIYANFAFLLTTLAVWSILAFVGLSGKAGTGSFLLLASLAVVPFVLLPGMVLIITEYQRGVLFRFGRLRELLGPGINVILPFSMDRVIKIDLRTFTIDVPRQEVITKDNIPVMVDAVVYFNVSDPILSVTKVANYTQSTTLLGQTTLRSILGQHDLDEILSKRGELNETLRQLLDEDTDPWGIKVTAVEIKSIEIPDSMKRAMARQAEAERERRAKVIAADGEFQASQKLLEAAEVIAKEPSTLHLRYLQTLTEISMDSNSTILFPMPIDLLKAFAGKKG